MVVVFADFSCFTCAFKNTAFAVFDGDIVFIVVAIVAIVILYNFVARIVIIVVVAIGIYG